MKLDKAIEILKNIDDTYSYPRFPNRKDALKLGIETLKRIKGRRDFEDGNAEPLLPGETED